jgi:hypothetical protein
VIARESGERDNVVRVGKLTLIQDKYQAAHEQMLT